MDQHEMDRHARDTALGPDVADAVTAYLTGGDPRGCAPDEIVAALDLPITATALQGGLERLVAHDTLARWGIGRGALYTRSAPSTDRSLVPHADAATERTSAWGDHTRSVDTDAPTMGAGH